jgi:hypothetical protein
MKILEVYGMRRSGHHAFIGWLKHNFDSKYGRPNVHYINDLYNNHSVKGETLEWKVQELASIPTNELLIVSYEDVFTNESRLENYEKEKIVFIRDIYNMAASRYQASKHGAMRIDETFIKRWIDQCNFPFKFRYEDFLQNKESRDLLCQHFDIPNLDILNDVNYCSNIGSSFIGRKHDTIENYLNRYQMVELPENIVTLITSEEVQEVREKLGYSVAYLRVSN